MKLIFLVLLLFPSHSQAAYDKTEWGMSIEKVKKLYPGGYLAKNQSGTFTYGVVRPIITTFEGYVLLEFDAKKKLISANILFPKAGTNVDLKKGFYTPATTEECEQTFSTLKGALKSKFGEPDSTSTSAMTTWVTKDYKDMVFLTIQTGNNGNPGSCNAAIGYGKVPDVKDLSKGL